MKAPLKPGDLIGMGKSQFVFQGKKKKLPNIF
jgi:hypothetical protein